MSTAKARLLPMECFRESPELPAGYRISNYGRVLSLQREILKSDGRKKTIPEKIISTQIHSNGYEVVTLRSQEFKKKTIRVHRLVALAFTPNPNPEFSIINHKDGNKLRNKPANLQWCNHSINNKHAYEKGLKKANTIPAITKRIQNSKDRKND